MFQPLMGEVPAELGRAHFTVSEPNPGVTDTLRGTPGGLGGRQYPLESRTSSP